MEHTADELLKRVEGIGNVAGRETGDYCELTLFGNIVEFRAAQVMDASPFELGLTAQDATVWEHVKVMVEAAYRLGLRDGMVKLGELA